MSNGERNKDRKNMRFGRETDGQKERQRRQKIKDREEGTVGERENECERQREMCNVSMNT